VNGQVFGTITTAVAAGVPTVTKYNFSGANRIPLSVPDGLSTTIFWTEKLAGCGQTLPGITATPGGTRWAGQTGTYSPTVASESAAGGVANPTLSLSPNITPQLNITNYNNCNWSWPSSSHSSGMQVAMGDGSVRNISSGMSKLTFNIAMVPNDGLVLGSDW
jgi:prepilin-type processing-associated H-X9-DG protein